MASIPHNLLAQMPFCVWRVSEGPGVGQEGGVSLQHTPGLPGLAQGLGRRAAGRLRAQVSQAVATPPQGSWSMCYNILGSYIL